MGMEQLGQITGMGGASNIFTTLFTAIPFIIAGLLFGGAIVFFINVMMYNIPVYLHMEVGSSTRMVKVKGKLDHKKKEFKVLRYKHVLFTYPPSEFYFFDGKKQGLEGYVKNEACVWMKVNDQTDNPSFKSMDIDLLEFHSTRLQKNWDLTQTKGNFWDKYGNQIILAGSWAFFIISVIFILREVKSAVEISSSAVSACSMKSVQQMALLPLLLFKKGTSNEKKH